MFFANIFSNMYFMFTYNCNKRNRIRLAANKEDPNTDDMLAENQVFVSIISAYFAPMMVTLCLITFGLEAYPNL